MTRRDRFLTTVATCTLAFSVLLLGCQTDDMTAPRGDSAADSDTPAAACPAGLQAPLGEACTTAAQVCAYGYNPRECGGRTVICTNGRWSEESHSDPQASCFEGDARPDGNGDGAGADVSVDSNPEACCPPDPTTSGCMHLGGPKSDGIGCARTCDFWCSTNWRIETSADGCQMWRYDTRQPAPGENEACILGPDAGIPHTD